MAPYGQRLAAASAVANHPRLRVTDLERRLGTRYTADTLKALKKHFPGVQFVWIMGADNLCQIPRWKRWTEFFESLPIAIVGRPSYSLRALSGRAARRYHMFRLPPRKAMELAGHAPPAWIFFSGRLHPASATRIRVSAGEKTERNEKLNGAGG